MAAQAKAFSELTELFKGSIRAVQASVQELGQKVAENHAEVKENHAEVKESFAAVADKFRYLCPAAVADFAPAVLPALTVPRSASAALLTCRSRH